MKDTVGGHDVGDRHQKRRRYVSQQRYEVTHPKVVARISTEYRERLKRVLQRERQSFSAWLRDRINEQEIARNPDSQGGVKKVIAEDVASLAWELLQAKGDEYEALAQAAPKRADQMAQRRELRERAGKYWEASAFFRGVLSQYQEVRAKLADGQIKPRHRPKARDEELPENAKDLGGWFGA